MNNTKVKVTQSAMRKLLGMGFALLLGSNCFGFALMGPYEDWMQYSNGFKFPGDIGGPMELHSEYRWNVPVITYGFDQSFMDFFGEEGKAAVEDAIQIFNDLPGASQIILTNYSQDTRQSVWGLLSGTEVVHDLKSQTMHLLLERLGLGSPVRSICVLRHFDPLVYPYSIVQFDPFGWPEEWEDLYEANYPRRNYDPETLAPSFFVNGFLFLGGIFYLGDSLDFEERQIDISGSSYSPVAEDNFLRDPRSGIFYVGLTRDDVGGLKYLLNSNNVNYEFLLPDIRGFGTNALSWVDGAWRPGVEKITFVAHPYDASQQQWIPATNNFTDTYLTNGSVVQQQVQRIVAQPDILFSAANNGEQNQFSFDVIRTDTSNWQNNALANGRADGAGPGVICPPAKIVFYRLSADCGAGDGYVSYADQPWGRFYNITNPPVVFPVSSYSGLNELEVNLKVFRGFTNVVLATTQKIPLAAGSLAVFQRSTNLISWSSLITVTNRGGVVDWWQSGTGRQEFFRIIPAP